MMNDSKLVEQPQWVIDILNRLDVLEDKVVYLECTVNYLEGKLYE